jgi:hypothetical protein
LSAAALIRAALDDGLSLKPFGEKLRLIGDEAIVRKWQPHLAAHKRAILTELNTAPQTGLWLVTYADGGTVKTWTDSMIGSAEILASRPSAKSAQYLGPMQRTPPAVHCKTCAHATGRHACGKPVEAGLSPLDGVIVYHPAAGKDCTAWAAYIEPELLALIDQAVQRFEFSGDDVEILRGMATSDPAGLKAAIAEFKDYPDRKKTEKTTKPLTY